MKRSVVKFDGQFHHTPYFRQHHIKYIYDIYNQREDTLPLKNDFHFRYYIQVGSSKIRDIHSILKDQENKEVFLPRSVVYKHL